MTDELFSCRNCINNPLQSLNIGGGVGFCTHHHSVINEPDNTTCKYLHRKDLPAFLVDEGVREHAQEYRSFADLATLDSKLPLKIIRYGDTKKLPQFDLFELVAVYLADNNPTILRTLAGGMDGMRALVFACTLRQYIAHNKGRNYSWLLVGALVEEIDAKPVFQEGHGYSMGDSTQATPDESLWDIVFSRLAAVQEYGWHVGNEELLFASDPLTESLAAFSWPEVSKQLAALRMRWHNAITRGKEEDFPYFPRFVYPPPWW